MSKRIMYLRDNNNPQGKGNPIACVAIEITDVYDGTKQNNKSHSNVHYQISICHPNDRFDRFTGQMKAYLKLEGRPLFVDTIDEGCISIHQVSSMVLSNISKNKNIPKRVRQSAERWLTNAANLKINKSKVESKQLPLFSLVALKQNSAN